MSDPPPPPQVSPDGKFYWDGQRWVPMPTQQAPPMSTQPASQPAPRATVGFVTRPTCLTCVGVALAIAALLLIVGVCSSIASHQ